MSDIKLFRIAQNGSATEINGAAADLEKPLQRLIEANLETLFGIRLIASEYATGKNHSGRIDSLGFDENNCPVILEYKRSSNENVINQGLFYLDWLMDHQAEFTLLVQKKYGVTVAETIDWSAPRLICIANDFTRYDDHAVRQINRNIELVRYRHFGPELLLLELVNAVSGSVAVTPAKAPKKISGDKTSAEWLASYAPPMTELFEALEQFVTSLGDDVQRKDLKLYVAFRKIRNFASVVPQKANLQLYLHLNPDEIDLEEGFTRDVRQIGHWGTGNLEVNIKTLADLEKAKPLLQQAYEGGSSAS